MSLKTVSYPNEEQLSFQKSTKKRLTPKRSFKFVADYDTAEEAKQFMEEHGSYSVVRTYNVKSGIKEEYRCNKVLLRGMACSSAFYIIYSCTDLSCSLYHTDSDHSCQEINENPDNRAHGIDQHTKTIIEQIVSDKIFTSATQIQRRLEKMFSIIIFILFQLLCVRTRSMTIMHSFFMHCSMEFD